MPFAGGLTVIPANKPPLMTVAKAFISVAANERPIGFEHPYAYRSGRPRPSTYQVIGKNAHDARLVAVMVCHGLTHIVAFNSKDFARYPGITILDPLAGTSMPSPP
jgi:hypothetical protein